MLRVAGPKGTIMNRPMHGSRRRAALVAGAVLALAATAALAGERIGYSYDSRGRLTKVVRTDTATNSVTATTNYSYDKADNRTLRETKNGQ
jgi:YD repeat-containing protein